MASFQAHSPAPRVPVILGQEHHAQVLAFLAADVPVNLFQLCWLENHGVAAPGRRDLYHFAGLNGPSNRLQAVALVISGRLLLIHATDPRAAAVFGRWYRRRGVVLEHIVSGRASVTPFWQAYQAEPARPRVSARLDRDQQLYVLERDRWLAKVRPRLRGRYDATSVRRAVLDELDAAYLASARMHMEETLENPLDTQPEAFRKHVRHRIQTNRCFVWFDDHHRLMFKADLSACSSFGTQISGVYTAPQFRSQGVATRALFDICEQLFESGLPRITLYVNAENEAAHRVYQKVGFEFHAEYQTVFVQSSDQ